MTANLEQLQSWVGPLLLKLEPAQRTQLARQLAQDLRRSQRQRIAAQQNPDGSAFEPRKPQLRDKAGSIRRKAMFRKLRQNRYLKVKADAGAVEAGFFGRVARLANVHQKGLHDRPRPGAPEVKYPQRELLGFSRDDLAMIENNLINYLQL
ncbi:phage virion morphogenesis protein [Motiliproteus sp.]|uniref:phage virion morphogenesis protein n=1 Tax=Motiliproteus sp. TaxID=1898955 RepID=UPI003BABF64A